MVRKLVSLAGWGLVRILPATATTTTTSATGDSDNDNDHDSTVFWEPRWVALESGSLLWYTDEAQVYPEDMTALLEVSVMTQRRLENGEVILTIKGENLQRALVSVELGISADEVVVWKQAIDMHVSDLLKVGTVVSPADLTMEDVDNQGEDSQSRVASIRITIRGETFALMLTPEDDAGEIARKFVSENVLAASSPIKGKDKMEKSIELELLKAQVNGCIVTENKLRKQVSQIRRRVGDVAIAEARASRAEQHASALASSLYKIQLLVPQIHDFVQKARKAVVDRDMNITRLEHQLKEEENYIRRLAKESDEMADAMLEKAEETRKLAAERDALAEDLQELEEHLDDRSHHASSSSPPPTAEAVLKSPDESNQAEQPGGTRGDPTLIEVRRQKVALTQVLKSKDSEIKNLKLDLQLALNNKKSSKEKAANNSMSDMSAESELKVKSNSSSSSQGHDRQELQLGRKMVHLEEKVRFLTGSLKASEDARRNLQTRYDELQSVAHTGSIHLKDSERELQRTAAELRELKINATVRNHDSILSENKTLRDEIIKFRGEVLRLQAQLDEVQSSAVQAVQSLQLLGPSSPFSIASSTSSPRRVPTSASPSASASAPVDYYLDLSSASASASASGRTPSTAASPAATGRSSRGAYGIEGNVSAELQAVREESVRYIWEPPADVASARISPVVEERLLHDIFNRYTGEAGRPDKGGLTLGRFGRFTKEFGISIISKGAAHSPPFLVNGEIDVIFLNASQATPDNRDLPDKAPRAFGVRAGAGTVKQYSKIAVGTAGSAPVISLGQFIVAVKVLACQLYANVIEHETGTVLECLPPRQKEVASRAVMDVLMKKKIMPTAEKLGLIPWPLIYLDQSLTSLGYFDAQKSLSRNLQQVMSWFSLYKSQQRAAMTYKDVSRFAHNFGYIPYLLKEPQLFR